MVRFPTQQPGNPPYISRNQGLLAGLPLRKAAFVTLDSILSSTLADKIGAEVIPVICSGLRDHDDVKMICHGLINKMAASPVWQGHLVAELPVITDALAVVLKVRNVNSMPRLPELIRLT
jgi:hypothetical protein